MSSRIVILGAGELGGAVAQAVATRDCVRQIVLIDTVESVASGKALDLKQSSAIDHFHTQITGTDDVSIVTGAQVCVIADRAGPPKNEWVDKEGLAMLRQVLQYGSGAPVIFAGTGQTEMLLRSTRDLGTARERLIGSAPEALVSAIRAIVAVEAECSPDEVSLSVLGVPAGGLVVVWSEATIGGHAVEHMLSQAQLNRLETRVAKLWPPGPYTLGAAAARIVQAVVESGRHRASVLTVLTDEFGVRNRVGILQALLGQGGIMQVQVPSLNTRERVKLESAFEKQDQRHA